jgi:PAS domain S-box-containing protein
MSADAPDSGASPSRSSGNIERAFLAAAVEQAADSFIITDIHGKIQYVNHSFTAMTGYSSEEAVGQKPSILKSGCHSAAFYKDLWSTIRSGRVWRGEVTNRRKDGTIYQEESRISPAHGENGEIVGYVAIKRDITERIRVEAALRESESRFRSMADSCPSMLWVTGPTGEVDFLNRGYREFSGLTLEETHGYKWRSLIHPDDAPEYLEKFDKAMRAHTSFSAEGRVRRADGEWRMIGSRGEPRFSLNGKYLGHIGLRADITERRKAEQLQEFQHSLIRAIYEGSLDGILAVNPDGIVMSHNKRLLDVWRIPLPEISGSQARSIVGIHHDPLLSAVLDRIKDPETYRRRIRLLDDDPDALDHDEVALKDGRTLERYSSCLRSETGQYLGRARFFRDLTEQKRTEQALRESEERFRIMADGCPMPMWVTGADAGIQFINRALRDFAGVTYEQVEGDNWRLFSHPDDAQAFFEESRRVVRERVPLKTETRFRRADGEWRWFAIIAEQRFSSSGEFLGHIGLGTDITERKQAEQALHSSEESFRQLAENIRQVFWLKEPGAEGFLYVSPAYEQVWGRSCASVYQDPNSRLKAIHPDDLAKSRIAFARQMQGEEVETEFRIQTPDGQEKWIRGRAFPVRDQGGTLIRIAGIAEDITEQKVHEEALIRARADAEAANLQLAAQHAILDNERRILRTFIDNVPDLMFVKDVESRFVVANPELARWAGFDKPEDLIGKTEFDVFPHEVARAMYEDNLRVIRSGKPMLNSEQAVGPIADGRPRIYLTTKVPLFDGDGQVTGIAGMARDITERKVTEDALRESNRELQESIERANRLAFEADAANRSKSEFLANMSHEIRTPMNGVLGMNGLLLNSDLAPDQRHYAEVVDASAKSLLTVIDDILDFSKVEAGRLEIDTLDFNLHVLMGDFAEMMSERLDEKQLEFICTVAPDVAANLQGDPGRLRQVLLNLVGNAIKFTRHGEVVVRVALISETDAEVRLRFSVRDTGIGIPQDKQQMLFHSFTQVDASTTRRYGGTGLGLAISKKLVELMGGEIGVESKEGAGSEFWFTLRLAKQLADMQSDLHDCLAIVLTGEQQEQRGALVTRHSLQKARRGSARILLVEDNSTNQEVAKGMLRRMGWNADVTPDGKEALQALETRDYDLVLMDVQMPVMDGYEATRRIRDPKSTVRNHDVPIIATTAHAMAGDAQKCLAAGMSDYIAKPIDPKILEGQVEKWLARKKHETPTASPTESAGKTDTPLPATPSSALVFNRENFLERMMGDEEFAHEVVAEFVGELPALLSALKQHVAQSDLESIWKQAHKIKGSAANVGGDALRDVALKVEQAGKTRNSTEVAHWVPELAIQAARLIDALQYWQAELSLSKRS